ncbi:hypothetical protein C6371_06120 [Bacillus atrophaeus]|uniref:hypothetical protein n=1 Tax=Bacillus atrophaeus TaxID=1452 RepID=UPI000D084759|nr:hypothetical protein [Bacillus atrophaeus]PSA91656.1 hypothetical protein C6371_06120 [Bacillus atrophaeus]
MNIDNYLDDQIKTYVRVAKNSTDPCIKATLIALLDSDVKSLLLEKIRNGYIYRGQKCLKRTSWEKVYVYFDFDCPPNIFCFIKPSFVAIVNMVTRQVEIIDPYINSHNSYTGYNYEWPPEIPKKKTQLTFSNHTGIDIHIEAKCDANWGPTQVNHGETPFAESSKVKFGNQANYCITVWSNNNGEPGDLLGSFDHKVRYNALGWTDALEFVIVSINGEKWLHVISARKLGEIIFKAWLGSYA